MDSLLTFIYLFAGLFCVFGVPVIAGIVLLRMLTGKKKGRERRPFDEGKLTDWKAAESVDVKKPTNPHSKFCLENIGQGIQIVYRGKKRTIVPRRVFRKKGYRKTYVEAEEKGELRTFAVDEMGH